MCIVSNHHFHGLVFLYINISYFSIFLLGGCLLYKLLIIVHGISAFLNGKTTPLVLLIAADKLPLGEHMHKLVAFIESETLTPVVSQTVRCVGHVYLLQSKHIRTQVFSAQTNQQDFAETLSETRL